MVSVPIFSKKNKTVSGPMPKAVATPKIRALVKFPGTVEATTGIEVTKQNGTWTFATDWSDFVAATSAPASPTNYVLTYDTLSKVYELVPTAALGGGGGGGTPSNASPAMDGTAVSGTSLLYSRGDHVHPHDTSKYDASNPSGYQTAAQVTTALAPYALLASPTFTGDPKAPTPTAGDNDTSIATTAWVNTAIAGVSGGGVSEAYVDAADALRVLKAGDTMTGHLTLPTSPAAANAVRKDYVDAADNLRVLKAGDTITGTLYMQAAEPAFILNKPVGTHYNNVSGYMNNIPRWQLTLGNGSPESGSNAGSDFSMVRFTDAGSVIDAPLTIARNTGLVTLTAAAITNSLASTSTSSGALIVTSGGVGVDGNIHADQVACAGATAGVLAGYFNTNTGISLASSSGGFLAVSRDGNPCSTFNVNADGQNIAFNRSGTTVGSVSVTTTATAYNTSSSADLKEDLQSFDAGRIVDNTEVYDFKWKSTGERAYGVVAQEAVEVYPTAVFHDETTDWWGINYQAYVPILLQELKALRARVAELEDKLTAKPS